MKETSSSQNAPKSTFCDDTSLNQAVFCDKLYSPDYVNTKKVGSEFGEIGLLSRWDMFKHGMSRNYFV